MDDNKFFKLVWRINGLMIFAVVAVSFVLLVFATYKVFNEVTRDRNVRNVVNVENSGEMTETFQLGHMHGIKGSPYVLIPLNSDQNYAQAYASKSSLSVRNYLFLNTNTNEVSWLLENNEYLLNRRVMLYTETEDVEENLPLAHLYEVIKSDTNSDNRLNRNDLITLALSRIDGTGYTEVVKEIDSLIGHKINEQGVLLVLYKKDSEAFSAHINLTNFTLSNKTNLPILSSSK